MNIPSADDDQADLLRRWVAALADELAAPGASKARIDPDDVDIDRVLGLAGVAAHAVVRPAAPLTTYVVGYAAGLAAAQGVAPGAALEAAAAAASVLATTWRDAAGDADGSADHTGSTTTPATATTADTSAANAATSDDTAGSGDGR
ncbi:DUF6457 domain-containing protein [Subtercola sp. YIM 133946]|uniref:DUF6457 domain-containing protein n=1 Tax=Subtercola sp. YIM 133946 TaxID=3118909 RepID=UPI002F947EEB